MTLTIAAIRERFAGASEARPVVEAGLPDEPLIAAAVLVPIVVRESGMTMLLTQRTAHLRDHAGQVSFP